MILIMVSLNWKYLASAILYYLEGVSNKKQLGLLKVTANLLMSRLMQVRLSIVHMICVLLVYATFPCILLFSALSTVREILYRYLFHVSSEKFYSLGCNPPLIVW